jgi:hypothetical protein
MCFLRQIFILLYFAKIQVELNGLGCDRKASYPEGIFDCYLYMKIEVKYETDDKLRENIQFLH